MTETIAILGLGEAGSAFASDLLAAGAHVRAYDPEVKPPQGAVGCVDEADAVSTAGLILSVNTARGIRSVSGRRRSPHVRRGLGRYEHHRTEPQTTALRRLSAESG